MTGSKRSIGSDLAKVDAHVITPEEYDEIPELTDEFFSRATVHVNGVPVRGRPPAEHTKRSVHLRLDPEILDHFRASGRGWQTRINDTLLRSVRRAKAKARA